MTFLMEFFDNIFIFKASFIIPYHNYVITGTLSSEILLQQLMLVVLKTDREKQRSIEMQKKQKRPKKRSGKSFDRRCDHQEFRDFRRLQEILNFGTYFIIERKKTKQNKTKHPKHNDEV